MRQEFQRADFGLLIGDDELLDGNELSIGFVRIATDGLYSTYRAAYGEKPALDMNFNPGKTVLPFPFTLEQFKAFCNWHPLFTPEIIEQRFTNDDGSIDNEALAELDDHSHLAGTLVRSILGIAPRPEETASPSGGVESDKAGPIWSLKTSIVRAPGYRWALYQVLKAAHIDGQPCPKPRDVLNIWTLKPPPDVQVMSDGVKYNDGLGNPKEANLKAIGQAIKNLMQ